MTSYRVDEYKCVNWQQNVISVDTILYNNLGFCKVSSPLYPCICCQSKRWCGFKFQQLWYQRKRRKRL